LPVAVRGRLLLAVLPLVVAGCGGNENVLHGESHQAHAIDRLWWVMFGVSCFGFMLVTSLLLLGWWRRNRRELPGGGDERVATWLVVGLGIAMPIVLLTALFVWSDIFVIRSTASATTGGGRHVTAARPS
jgi:heme/copper-type cytochrome/quinol oxidase subunit 2